MAEQTVTPTETGFNRRLNCKPSERQAVFKGSAWNKNPQCADGFDPVPTENISTHVRPLPLTSHMDQALHMDPKPVNEPRGNCHPAATRR